MSIIILFGLPGAGKTYVGKIFEKHFGYYFYEGDNDLTEDMRESIKIQRVFTDQMRDVFFKKLIGSIIKLKSRHDKIVVAQTFIKERYRTALINSIPGTKYILIETKDIIREKRLAKRTDYPLEKEYARQMVVNFDKPMINYLKITNNVDGGENIKKQIKLLKV